MQRKVKLSRREKIKFKIRKKIKGTADVPRLSVFRSNQFTYASVIDDTKGAVLFSASTKSKDFQVKGTKVEKSKEVGKIIGEKCKEKNINKVVFDRNGYLYHGRVKAVAEGARECGLEF